MSEGELAMVTGGGTGIGAALARRLAADGLDVLIAGRREAPLRETANRARIDWVTADLAEAEGREALVEAIGDRRVGYLVHNAGVLTPVAPLGRIDPADWRANFAINVEAPLFLTQALLPNMRDTRVLLVSSGAAQHPITHWSAYCCAKAALHMLFDCMNVELNGRGIICASARPGVVDTPMQDTIREYDEASFPDVHRFRTLKAEGRLHPPSEVADFFAWLLLECGPGAFPSRDWDIDDTDHHTLWKNLDEA